MTKSPDYTWHVLDVASIPVAEYASALHNLVPTLGWLRQTSWFAPFRSPIRKEQRTDPPLPVAVFKRQRGSSSALLANQFGFARRLTQDLLAQSARPEWSPLICTSAFYAPVAELWPGPVIYYSTDLTYAYERINPQRVLAFDRRLCAVASLVCPNSTRIGEYLVELAGCDPAKIFCLPNATRSSNILEAFPSQPADLPEDIRDLPRPVAGVIGNLAGNLDWILLEKVIRATPWLSWVFVGPTDMRIRDYEQGQARQRVRQSSAHTRFVGFKAYGSLKDYARAFDVAVLPYFKREPTFSGSATRFYEHLAACRPMLATRGVDQLLEKEPLLRLVDSPEQMGKALDELRATGFEDGFERIRWAVSRQETWLDRAKAMLQAFEGMQPKSPITTEFDRLPSRPFANC